MDRYVQATGDRLTLRHAIPTFSRSSSITCAARASTSAWTRATAC
jgi:hypothetical protein